LRHEEYHILCSSQNIIISDQFKENIVSRACSMHGRNEKSTLVGLFKWQTSLGSIGETGRDKVNWIHLAQDRDQ
jgi:hypothetical protein